MQRKPYKINVDKATLLFGKTEIFDTINDSNHLNEIVEDEFGNRYVVVKIEIFHNSVVRGYLLDRVFQGSVLKFTGETDSEWAERVWANIKDNKVPPF